MNAIVSADSNAHAGVIYVLKNRTGDINIDKQNRLHPFYIVYVSDSGEVICDHLSPKATLDKIRYLCKGKTLPDQKLCAAFNKETDDGKNMKKYSELLSDAISSIINVKEESDIDSLFSAGGTSLGNAQIKGLDDSELIDFIVVR